jgi:hypothetical protein
MKFVLLIALGIVLAVAVGFAARAHAATRAAQSCTPKMMNGTPCKPFTNRAQTLRFVRQTLLANGFYSAGLRLTITSPQQMSYSGIQNGERTWGDVFKIGDRKLWISFDWIDPDLGRSTGFSHTFPTSFVA